MSESTIREQLEVSGWKRLASGKYKHPNLSQGGGRAQLVTEIEAWRHQKQWNARAEAQFGREIRKTLSQLPTSEKQLAQRVNLVNAMFGVPKWLAEGILRNQIEAAGIELAAEAESAPEQ